MSQNSNNNPTDSKITIKYFIRHASGPLIFLLIFIMICSFLAHYLNDSETLQEYADSNPNLAYGADSPPPDSTDATPTQAPGSLQSPDQEITYENADTASKRNDGSSEDQSDTALDQETSSKASAYNTSKESVMDTADNPDADVQQSKTDDEKHGGKEDMTRNPERTTYQDGFYYEPLSEDIKQKITGISYPETGCTVPYEDLNYVGLLYIDFDGEAQEGELICNKAIAQDMVEIFYELFQNDYRIERIRLIDEYGGDDTLSMEDNNTSCFNYRVVDGTTNLSKHALGCAIDINPFYNPYVVYNKNGNGDTYISPKGSEVYADRSRDFPYKIDENDLCYKLFTAHGFTWGGNWNSSKDYQHFQIILE